MNSDKFEGYHYTKKKKNKDLLILNLKNDRTLYLDARPD